MKAKQLREHVIEPTLRSLGMWSKQAEDLLLETACQESHCGEYIRQLGCSGYTGAFGIYQMEIATARDIYDRFINKRPAIKKVIDEIKGPSLAMHEAMTVNLAYATALARIKYYLDPKPIPMTLEERAEYWKRIYNTKLGKGKPEEYIKNAQKYGK